MDIYWTGGDELRIADFDTPHPRLQISDAGRWSDCSPKLYPRSLFALSVSLLSALDAMKLLDHEAVADCGIYTVEPPL